MRYYPVFFRLIFSAIAGFLFLCLHWISCALQSRETRPVSVAWLPVMCGKSFLTRKLVLVKVWNGSFFMRVAG